MLCLVVVAASAAATPLAARVDSPTNSTNETNTTEGASQAAEAPIAQASDGGRQRPWWERLSERHRELHKGQSWCVVVARKSLSPSPSGLKHSLCL